jgi:uncharacterized membrane protein
MNIHIAPKKFFLVLISLLFLTDISIIYNIPFFRQILAFFTLTFLFGLLVLKILKLDNIETIEFIILSIGISISFVMIIGIIINNLSLKLNYDTPLSTNYFLTIINVIYIFLIVIGYKINKNSTHIPFNLNIHEKMFLILPSLFPLLSISGIYLMNKVDNNILILLLLILIALCVSITCISKKITDRSYPFIIYFISLSLLLLMALRSNHIVIGSDTGREFYLFKLTLNNLHWELYSKSSLDACLSISLLPAVYQSFLNIDPEYVFKLLYSLLYSICPLIVYLLSKKYIGESYAFLAACFYMFQGHFLIVAATARTSLAILFFAISMMTLFSERIDLLSKRFLFIIFIIATVLSHYSTTYAFFIVLTILFIFRQMISTKYSFDKNISNMILVLFFGFIFIWYSQLTEVPFNSGITFIERTFANLNSFFLEESRRGTEELIGAGVTKKGIPHIIKFVYTWMTFLFIGLGLIVSIIKHKEMVNLNVIFKKAIILKQKIDFNYFLISIVFAGILFSVIVLPYVSRGYDMNRIYPLTIVILSLYFVIGGKIISKYLGVRPHAIILLVLLPYFFSISGITYQVFNEPHSIILNSQGERYNEGSIIHDQGKYSAKWISNKIDQKETIYTTPYARDVLPSQGLISPSRIDKTLITKYIKSKKIDGYIYLRYRSIPNRSITIYEEKIEEHVIEDYPNMLSKKKIIYNNGDSEVWF